MMRFLPFMLILLLVIALSAGVWANESAGQTKPDVALSELLDKSTMKARQEFAIGCELTAQDFQIAMRTKAQIGKLQEALREQLRQLAITLASTTLPDEQKTTRVTQYMKQRDETLAACDACEQQLIKQIGADLNPLKLGALIILGAVDSGRQTLCAVKSPVSGGAQGDLLTRQQNETLQDSFGKDTVQRQVRKMPRKIRNRIQ